MLKILTLITSIALFLWQKKEPQLWELNGRAQGTTYSIKYYHQDSLISQKQIDSIFSVIDNSMSLYLPSSTISKFNRSPGKIEIDSHLKRVIERSLQVHKDSKGVFDITIEPLVRLWGFGYVKSKVEPDAEAIKAIKKYIGTDKIELKENYLYKKDPRVNIDLNGIAQGYTVDVLAGFLELYGIESYLVELGGEIKAKGKRPDSQNPFIVGIESPSADPIDPTSIQKTVYLKDKALTTSGNYRKFRMAGNVKLSHLINPKTGYPLNNEMISATVLAPDAMTADAYDNVFMGLGVKKSLKFLKKRPELDAYFIYLKADGSIADTMTSGFRKIVRTEVDH